MGVCARLTVVGLLLALPVGAQSQEPTQTRGQVNTQTAALTLTLQQVFDSLRANNPSTRAAEARVRAAEGARRTAGAFGNPVLSFQVDNTPFPGGTASLMEREAVTTATLPLEPFYQRGSRIRRANADVSAAGARAFATRQRIALDAAHAYYQTATAQVAVSASRDLLAWLDSLVVYTRTRVHEGATAEADLLRSELERDRVSAELAMQQSELARNRAGLATFAGSTSASARRGGSIEVAVDSVPFLIPALARTLQSPSALPRGDADQLFDSALVRRALASRPEIQAARQQFTSASAGVAVERSMLVRQLGATFGTKLSGGVNTMVAGISFPFPLFDQNRGEVARATAERDAAAFELAALVRDVQADVMGASEAAHLLTVRAESLSRGPDNYLTRADDARRITLGAYREGAVPLTQVLDAARAWGEARTAYFGILFAQHESVLVLAAAGGDDLFSSSITTTRADCADRAREVRPSPTKRSIK